MLNERARIDSSYMPFFIGFRMAVDFKAPSSIVKADFSKDSVL